MLPPTSTLALQLLAVIPCTLATTSSATYILTDNLLGADPFDAFNFDTFPDPTHGFVRYQGRDAAFAAGLAQTGPDATSTSNSASNATESSYAIFGAGPITSSTSANPTGAAAPGPETLREGTPSSVRLTSKKTWHQGLFVADIRAPAYGLRAAARVLDDGRAQTVADGRGGGRSTLWRACTKRAPIAWGCTRGPGVGWGNGGRGPSSYHNGGGGGGGGGMMFGITSTTSFSCVLETETGGDCDVTRPESGNRGCGIRAQDEAGIASFGRGFNEQGGGWYVVEWTDESISVWFVPRHSQTSSALLFEGGKIESMAGLGTPMARFGGGEGGCDVRSRFEDMAMVFNTNVCGDWAGGVWEESGCKKKTGVQTCEEYAKGNEEAFGEAYWNVSRVAVYQRADEVPGEGGTATTRMVASSMPPDAGETGVLATTMATTTTTETMGGTTTIKTTVFVTPSSAAASDPFFSLSGVSDSSSLLSLVSSSVASPTSSSIPPIYTETRHTDEITFRFTTSGVITPSSPSSSASSSSSCLSSGDTISFPFLSSSAATPQSSSVSTTPSTANTASPTPSTTDIPLELQIINPTAM
ncbi:hypothetical protein LTS18_008530, partial [Coniosporium uncinatum]